MTRRMYQEFEVFRGHHGIGGSPDDSTVGVTSWTPSLGAADLYAREPSIEGMQAEFPTVSKRTYTAEYPAVFFEDRVDIQRDLIEDMGFEETEASYVLDNYGAHPNVWEMMNDPNVQDMMKMHGADAVIYPEQVKGNTRVNDMEGQTIQTFRPLADYDGETESVFVGDGVQVAGAPQFVREGMKEGLQGFVDWLGTPGFGKKKGRLTDDPARLTKPPKDIAQENIPRYEAPKGAPASISALYDEKNIENVMKMAQRGIEMGANAWYNLQPLRKAAHAALGKEAGDIFTQGFLRRVAATSPRGAVSQNITRASYFDWRETGMVPTDNFDYLMRIYGEKNVRMQGDEVWYRPISKPSAARQKALGISQEKGGWFGPFKRQSLEEILDQSPIASAEELSDSVQSMPGIKSVYLTEKDGVLTLHDIQVEKDQRKQGIGTAAMKEILRYANSKKMRVELTPGLKDDATGTTSRSRLVKFYKEFGFQENKGRNKDFATSAGMIRPAAERRRRAPAKAASPAEAGYGHLAHKVHSAMLSEISETGEFDPLNRPKASSFFWNLFGNWEPVTADSHFNRAIGLRNKAGKLKDTPTNAEYKYIEEFSQQMADRLGIEPAQFQAAVWMGAGDMGVTPVADPRIWMQMFNTALDKTANWRGESYEKVLHDFLTGRAPLLATTPFAFLFGSLGEDNAAAD